MSKTKKELLDDYDTRVVKWYLARGAVTQYLKEGGHPSAQNHWNIKLPWPLTEEENEERTSIYQELAELEEEIDDEPKHLLFYTTDSKYKVKFVK